jgi:uridylate kinase
LIKATKVNGVYAADPVKVADAPFYKRVTFDKALREDLKIMDATALVLCRDHNIPLRVMNIYDSGALMRLMQGEDIGSLVENA